MSSQSFLGIQGGSQPYKVTIIVTLAIYAGIFVMISNHYIFRPRVEFFFIQSSITSKALHQLLIDVVTNLSQLTFLTCTIFISNSDSALSVVIYSDIAWSGLYVGLLAFRGLFSKETGNWKLILIKNIIFLGMIYATIAVHYLGQNYLVSLGLIFLLLYFLNLTIDNNQQKFVSNMQYLFNYRPQHESQNEYRHRNKMISPQFLSKNFPVTSEEIKDKMKNYDKEVRYIKLKTKSLVAQRLMKIALAVHLSKQKLEAKAKRDIRNYYGTFNGTVADKSRKLIVNKGTTQQEQLFSQQSDLIGQSGQGQEQFDSCLFYIFPVKLFQKNRFLSIIFSLLINIGFGVLLSLSLFITDYLPHGEYAHILYGVILLPMLPSVSKTDFFSSMSLSSLWKYCLYGLILSCYCLTNGSMTFVLAISGTLSFSPIIQLLAITVLTYMLVTSEQSRYRLLFVWGTVNILNLLLIFKFC